MAEHELLFQLRSPTLPLDDKLVLVQDALQQQQRQQAATTSANHAQAVSVVVRDWVISTMAKQLRHKDSSMLLGTPWWKVLAQTSVAVGGSSAPSQTLAIFTAAVSAYIEPSKQPDGQLVQAITAAWTAFGSSASRKALIDHSLDALATMLAATVTVTQRAHTHDVSPWHTLAVTWINTFRPVLDAAKAAKKVSSFAVTNLHSVLLLLELVTAGTNATLRSSILDLVQLTLFNVESLKRGLARESYHATSTSSTGDNAIDKENAAGEIVHALLELVKKEPAARPRAHEFVGPCTRLYFDSLAKHSDALFPLPAKSTFPNASAARSAAEIHALQKRRALAAAHTSNILTLLSWTNAQPVSSSGVAALSAVLELVEAGDLYRQGQTPEWEVVLGRVVTGVEQALGDSGKLEDLTRDANFVLLQRVLRLSYDAISPKIASILAYLAAQRPSPCSAVDGFLSDLLELHSRSLSVPDFLKQVVSALSMPQARQNNCLTSRRFVSRLDRALTGLVGQSTITSIWQSLVGPLSSSSASDGLYKETTMDADTSTVDAADQDADRPKKKRRKVSLVTDTTDLDGGESTSRDAAVRLRVSSWFVSSLNHKHFEAIRSDVQEFAQSTWSDSVKQFCKSETKQKKKKKGKRRHDSNNESRQFLFEMVNLGVCVRDKLRSFGEGLGSWRLGTKRLKEMLDVLTQVEDGDVSGEAVVLTSRLLLQAVELGECDDDDSTHDVLRAVLDVAATGVAGSWDGDVRDVDSGGAAVAVWEMVTSRSFAVIDAVGSTENLERFAALFTLTLRVPSMVGSSRAHMTTFTQRLLKRADLYEMRRIQPFIQRHLVASVTLDDVSSPISVLSSTNSKVSITVQDCQRVLATFEAIASFVPPEYLGRRTRSSLIERALGLDLILSDAKVAELNVTGSQTVLRRFANKLFVGQSADLNEMAQVLAHLVKRTSSSDEQLVGATLDLFTAGTKSAVQAIKDGKNFAPLESFVSHLDKPFSTSSAQRKRDSLSLTCEEKAVVVLCDVVVSSFGDKSETSNEVKLRLKSSFEQLRQPVGKALSAAVALLKEDASRIVEAAGLIEACRGVWGVLTWLGIQDKDNETTFASFAQTALATLTLSVGQHSLDKSSLSTCVAMLDLLAFRLQVARQNEAVELSKAGSALFETFIACQYASRSAYVEKDELAAFDVSLRRVIAGASLEEYKLALDDITNAIAVEVSADRRLNVDSFANSLASPLSLALALLREGPEGSTRLGAACFSEVLQHFSVAVSSTYDGADPRVRDARVFLLVSRFIEGVCADRPLMLSRGHVGAIFALVNHILEPAGQMQARQTATNAIDTATASSLYASLVSTITHIIRHRKDHVTPLFPLLVSCIASLVAVLRRPGFGSTGSGAGLHVDAGPQSSSSSSSAANFAHATTLTSTTTAAGLGRRAEREARASFPEWAWTGGPACIDRDEAILVGRLLGSLATKTTSFVHSGTSKTTNGADGRLSSSKTVSLIGPLSKHAPFILLPYLQSCVDSTCPIPSFVRRELQNGWYEVMDTMGKWEKESLMKGFLGDDDEAERNVLRDLYKGWESERYKGS
ncbi:hypothetical protein ACM66B_002031 [Microbotryomycetes sp. NB124-2]